MTGTASSITPSSITNVSRRQFVIGGAVVGLGGLTLGCDLMTQQPANPLARHLGAEAGQPFSLFVAIDDEGTASIVATCPEIGQGARTAIPAIIADELEADWGRVRIVQALPDKQLGSQSVGGSSAIRDNIDNLRRAGASARAMLEEAAARVWEVPASECTAINHRIVHKASARSLDFGAVAAAAGKLPVPDAATLKLKSRDEFRYIGTDMGPVDGDDIVHGRAVYGIDVTVPGMRYAAIARAPVVGGKVVSYKADKALAVTGVSRIVEVEGATEPPGFNSMGGIAVVADNSWSALKGRDLLEIEWNDGPHGAYDSEKYREELKQACSVPGTVARNRGDVDAAFSAGTVIEADYYVPHHVHAPMEPPVAVADVSADGATVWMPNQDPTGPQAQIATALGLAPELVRINTTLAGGGFGRKGKPDYGTEAALISKAIGAPVKVVWDREDDIRHSYYHAVCAQHLKAAIDKGGKVSGWLHRTAFPSISSTFQPGITEPSDGEMALGCTDVPWDIANIRCEKGQAISHLRTGWYRSVDNINHAFAVGSMVDEIAHHLKRDTAGVLLELIGPPRHIDLAADGVKYPNHGKDLKDYPIDTGRMAATIRRVMAEADWGAPLAAGRGRGIAFHKSFLTCVAAVVEVAVDKDGELSIPRVTYAVDCGLAVNPDRIRAQLEGGAIFAISTALYGRITARGGRVEQGNFDDYVVTRMDAAPEVDVHIIDSEARATGVGEPPVPPIAPALCNAIFAATGKRIRELPIADQLKA